MFSATAGTGYNWISQKAQLNLGFTYGDRFFNDKLGMMAAISYQNAPSGSDDVEFEYDVNKKGEVVMVEAQKRQYYVTREHQPEPPADAARYLQPSPRLGKPLPRHL